MTDTNMVGVLMAALGFVLAYLVARFVSAAIRKRQKARERAQAANAHSRQVRRAMARRSKH